MGADIIGQLRGQSDKRKRLFEQWVAQPAAPAAQPAPPAGQLPPGHVAAELALKVTVASPPDWNRDGTWQRYQLEAKDNPPWQVTVVLAGTKDDLLKAAVGTSAVLTLTDADKNAAGKWVTRQVTLLLPEGVGLVGAAPSLTFRLVETVRMPAL